MLLKSNFKLTIRYFLRDKSYLLINILSLSAGLLCCLFIFKYVQHEWSYDQFHKNAESIFRIELDVRSEEGTSSRYAYLGTSPVNWLHKIPEIQQQARFARFSWDMNVDIQGERFTETGIISADSSFFNLFSFKLIKGNPNSVLEKPNSVVLTQSIANKYFGTRNVLGNTILISYGGYEAILNITGIVEDVPSNSHFSFDVVTSADAYKKLNGFSLRDYPNTYCYVRIATDTSINELDKKFNALYQQNTPEAASVSQFYLQPMTAIHLHSSAIGELSTNGNTIYVYLFLIVAYIILGIACVNFATLATTRSVKRSREMGIRKVFGAEKSSLIFTGLQESVILSFAGLGLSYLVAWFLLPQFNELAGKSFSFAELFTLNFFFIMLGGVLLVGIISGLYPSLILSQHKPINLVRRTASQSPSGGMLWKSMVITQITISMVLIGATYIIQKQIDFIYNKDLGFDKEQVLTFPNYFDEQRTTFMEQLKQHPNIKQATVSSYIPGVSKTVGMSSVKAEGKSATMTFEAIVVDPYFFDTYKIPIAGGRDFSEERASDITQAFVINETAVQKLGWENPIGKKLYAYGQDGYVIGVVKDFNFVSLYSKISPMVFLMSDRHHAQISARIKSGQALSETLAYIRGKWEELLPGIPFRYHFLDNQFNALYKSELKVRSLFFSFSLLAIIIVVLGLFSFTSYTVQQKTREIGIRKVLGATIYNILKLFFTGYAKLLAIATLLALPATFILISYWLQNFPYKTDIGLEVFAIPLFLTLAILIISVSYQTVMGALQNPAETIRYE